MGQHDSNEDFFPLMLGASIARCIELMIYPEWQLQDGPLLAACQNQTIGSIGLRFVRI